MAETLASRITVHEEGFDTSKFTSVNNLSAAYMSTPDLLRPNVTKMMGEWQDSSKQFPLLSMLEGGGRVGKAEISNHQFEYPIIGAMKETELVHSTNYSSSDIVGGGSEAYVDFRSDWFVYGQIVISPTGVACRVQDTPKRIATNRFRYRLMPTTPDAVIPFHDIQENSIWGVAGPSKVSVANSVGTYGHVQTPGRRKGVINTIRKSYHLAGNIANKVVEFNMVDIMGNTSNYWLSWYEFQQWLEFKKDRHMDLFLSEYSYRADGSNVLFDDYSGDFVPSGAGLKQQITQSVTYTTLTERFFDRIVGSTFRGKPDNGNLIVTVFCGGGFREEFHRAMINSELFQLVSANTSLDFLKQKGANLTFGNYIDAYKHIDGPTYVLVPLEFLDKGGYADRTPVHPLSGRRLSSYEAYIVDASNYNGQSNIQLLSEKGRGEIKGLEQGMAIPTGLSAFNYKGNGEYLNLATGTDRTSVHFLCTQGVVMYNDTWSVKFLPDYTAWGY